jgi:hypothetical protein
VRPFGAMTPNYFITQMKTLETEKKITINGVKITLKKLPLRKIIGLLSDLQTLPEQVTNIDKMPSDKILETLPLLIAGVMPTVSGLIIKAVDQKEVTEDFLLDECGLDDNIELVTAILEVNNIAKILESIKKIKGLRTPQAQA